MDVTVIEETVSVDGARRARLLRRKDGLIEVLVERRVPGDGVYEPAYYWSRVNRRAIVTDSVERGRELAAEELALSAE